MHRHKRKESATFLPFAKSHQRTCTSIVDLTMYLLPIYKTLRYTIIMAIETESQLDPNYPKSLHLVGNKPMIVHMFESVHMIGTEIVLVLSNKNKNIIIDTLVSNKYLEKLCDNIYYYKSSPIHILIQEEINGTGGAIKASSPFFINKPDDANILILCADTPLLTSMTLESMFNIIENDQTKKCVILTRTSEQNFGYGRIVQKQNNIILEFVKIGEQKDCKDEYSQITLLNTGVYLFKLRELFESLEKLSKNNTSNEYYLSDCPEHIINKYPNSIELLSCKTYDNCDESFCINTKEQLEQANEEYYKNKVF